MAITHTKNVNGWLPYGSDDPSILLQHPLTSNPAAYFATKGATTVSGSGLQTFDPIKGMCPNGSGGYRIQSMSRYLDLDAAGQIGYEVERDAICRQTPNDYSFGYLPPAADQYCMSTSPTAGGALILGAKTSGSTGGFNVFLGGGSISALISSAAKGDFVRVNIGWSGGRVGGKLVLAIDGIVVLSAALNDATTSGMFEYLYLGSDRQIAGSYMAQHYMRNLQISTKAPMFAAIPSLRGIGMVSDSMNGSDSPTSQYAEAVTSWTMRRELAKRGLFIDKVSWANQGGATLAFTAGQHIATQLPAVLAANPLIVIVRGGTNDVNQGRATEAGWQAEVESYITTCLATQSVQTVIFLGIPSFAGAGVANTTAIQSQRVTAETKIQAACDAWRAANPTDPRKVLFANDMYDRLGGETPPPGTYLGQVNGLWNDLHLSGYGHYIHGKVIADWIVSTLR